MAGTSAEAAADQLTAQFEVELPLARRDVEQFVFRLQDLGVIPRGDEGEPSGGARERRVREPGRRAGVAPLTVAVSGLSATDNPAPGVAVIRAIRAAAGRDCRVIGLAYDALDPGAYLADLADAVFLMPFPSQGAEAVAERLEAIHRRLPIDVLLPCLDSELPALLAQRGGWRRWGSAPCSPRGRRWRGAPRPTSTSCTSWASPCRAARS